MDQVNVAEAALANERVDGVRAESFAGAHDFAGASFAHSECKLMNFISKEKWRSTVREELSDVIWMDLIRGRRGLLGREADCESIKYCSKTGII